MLKPFAILLFPSVVIAAVHAPDLVTPAATGNEALACSAERVATFGWTHENEGQAELAAILRWKEISAEQGAAYSEWHLAYNRHLSCRHIGKTRSMQCRISGTPCRLKEKKQT